MTLVQASCTYKGGHKIVKLHTHHTTHTTHNTENAYTTHTPHSCEKLSTSTICKDMQTPVRVWPHSSAVHSCASQGPSRCGYLRWRVWLNVVSLSPKHHSCDPTVLQQQLQACLTTGAMMWFSAYVTIWQHRPPTPTPPGGHDHIYSRVMNTSNQGGGCVCVCL